MDIKLILIKEFNKSIKILHKIEEKFQLLKKYTSQLFLIDMIEYILYYESIEHNNELHQHLLIDQQDYDLFLRTQNKKQLCIYIIERIKFIDMSQGSHKENIYRMFFEDIKQAYLQQNNIEQLFQQIKNYFKKNKFQISQIEIFIDNLKKYFNDWKDHGINPSDQFSSQNDYSSTYLSQSGQELKKISLNKRSTNDSIYSDVDQIKIQNMVQKSNNVYQINKPFENQIKNRRNKSQEICKKSNRNKRNQTPTYYVEKKRVTLPADQIFSFNHDENWSKELHSFKDKDDLFQLRKMSLNQQSQDEACIKKDKSQKEIYYDNQLRPYLSFENVNERARLESIEKINSSTNLSQKQQKQKNDNKERQTSSFIKIVEKSNDKPRVAGFSSFESFQTKSKKKKTERREYSANVDELEQLPNVDEIGYLNSKLNVNNIDSYKKHQTNISKVFHRKDKKSSKNVKQNHNAQTIGQRLISSIKNQFKPKNYNETSMKF